MKTRINLLFFALYATSFIGGIADLVQGLPSITSYITLTADLIFTILGISVLTSAPKRMVLLFFALIICSFLTYSLNPGNSLLTHINGLREFTGLVFLFIFFNKLFKDPTQYYFNKRFKKFTWIFLLTQIPFSLYQYVKAGFKAGDTVGGSLGPGYSGVLTFAIFILMYYLVEDKGSKNSLGSKLRYLLTIIYCLLPITINETKISFILIPLYFLSLVKMKEFKTSILGIGIAVLLLSTFTLLYSDKTRTVKNPVDEIFNEEFLDMYLAGKINNKDINQDIPRFTKLIIGSSLLSSDNDLIFGEEYGAFKGGTTVAVSAFAQKYNWLLLGSRPYLFFMMMSGGISLIVIIYFLFIGEIFFKPHPGFKNYSSSLLIFLSLIFLLMQGYNDALRNQTFAVIFIYALFYAKYNKTVVRYVS